ncbi:S-adenosyl-L-methionine-dependent methyltransferase [Clohesyomyces aquaticus]|uniref:S-adenosyl-L-methionine-dependent methyltransferase n=1 Tax=Clohesyomyces aquaticus TaxID=1231657 RepID=A0A1Y1ZNM6_9PLEO|nr:S-adenosyl-L-methionine-dependent methyltransferase [Clohesyomyces aquaticus]
MAAEYSKGRNLISATKLNYFHYFLKQLSGYSLHPRIKLPSSEPARIADLGTQTAIWPITLADDPTLSIQVDGFDLSPNFFPPAPWRPNNVELHVHDIYTPFNEGFLGKFHVVHLRLFLTLSSEKVSAILRNAMTLLKPGGYIQWTEHDKTNITPTAAYMGQSAEAAQAFIDLQKEPFPGYDPLWVNGIASAMTENGLQVAAEDRIRVRASMLPQMNELHLISLMDVQPGLSKAIDDFRDKYMEKLKEEYSNGVSTIDGFITVVGQKPSN